MSVISEPNPVRQFETLLESSSFVFLICKYLPTLCYATPHCDHRSGNVVAYSQHNQTTAATGVRFALAI